MRLLHVIGSTNPETGGPIEAVRRISEVLIRAGHDVRVATLETSAEAEARDFPCPITGVGSGIGRYGLEIGLNRWLRRHASSFDVVLLHGLWNYSSVGSWLSLRRRGPRYYIFAHGMMDPWFKQSRPLNYIAKQLYWWLGEGRVLRDANAVLFTCEEEKRRARGVFKGHWYREQVVLFGTADVEGDGAAQIQRFQQAFPALRARRFLLFLGRIHPKKGCDLLIRAFADIVSEIPEDMDLVIAGPDQTGWSVELQRLADERGVGDRIHWPGMLQGDIKWGALRAAEAMILPSHQENFGFVVAEALACATPVLMSDKVNIWREVNAAGGCMVEPDTEEGTRSLIRRFLALTDQERCTMSAAARRCFEQNFDVETTALDLARAIGLNAQDEKG